MTTNNTENFEERTTRYEGTPAVTSSRISSLDVLRGFAVLMIFVVNIKMMANGYNHYADRSLWDGPYDHLIAYVHSVFVHGKFVTIFTALFGAGLALLLARENPVPVLIVLKRLFWLAVFGAIHLILIREGDIVMQYALVGFFAIFFVKMQAPLLLALGFAIQIGLLVAGIIAPYEDETVPVLWKYGPEAHIEVKRIMLGTLSDQISARLDTFSYYMVDLFVFGRSWIDKLSVMLFGMALLKIGFLTGELSRKAYWQLGLVGAAMGTALIVGRLLEQPASPLGDSVVNVLWRIHRFGGALFWSALVIGLVSAGWKFSALAAAGRMAFTIYILESVIGLLLFSSLGLGLFGHFSLGGLTIITTLVLAFFLIAAPLWLSKFRFGPLEWLWRSLSYGQRQRMLRGEAS
ncbi:MAG: DUF418 domain-containing protein [Pseudomonadota bacterium]